MNGPMRHFARLLVVCLMLAGTAAAYLRHRFAPSYPALVPTLVALPLLALGAVAFQRAQVWQNPLTLWQDAVAKYPERAFPWERLAGAYHMTGASGNDGAIAAYNRALKLDPKNDMALYNMAVMYMDLGENDKAFDLLQKLLKLKPEYVMGWVALGDIYMLRSDYPAAETAYKRAYALQPDAVKVLSAMGNVSMYLGHMDKARYYYGQIEARERDNPDIAYQLACVESLAGQADATIYWLNQALQRGYRDLQTLMTSEELAPIRADRRFGELMQKYFPGEVAPD